MQLSVSDILSRTFAMAKARFWLLAGMYLSWFGILIGAMLLFFAFVGGSAAVLGSTGAEAPSAGMGLGMIAAALLFYVAYLYLACAQYASMSTLASPLANGKFGDAFGTGLRAGLPLLGVMVLLLVGYFVLALPVGLLIGLMAEAGAAVTGILGFFILGLVLWLGARIGIVFAVVPVDGVHNPFRAIGRAWNLTSGNALPIFLSFVVFMVIAAVVVGVMALPFMGMLTAMGDSPDPSDIGAAISGMGLLVVVFVVGGIAIAVLYAALISAIHGMLAGSDTAAATFE